MGAVVIGRLNKFNEAIAVRATVAVSTVWCVYIFTVLSLLPLAAPAIQAQILYVSNCFQLIFLPLIMVGQGLMERRANEVAQVLADKKERRDECDHQAIMAQFAEIKAIRGFEGEEAKMLKELLAKVDALNAEQ